MFLLLLACAQHIPPGADVPAFPSPAPANGLKVCRVETATGSLPAGLVVAHGKLKTDVVSTQGGLLLVHPKGSWLVDGGMAADFLAHIQEVKGIPKLLMTQSAKDWKWVAKIGDAVRAHGVDPATLTGVIPTHGHYDHLGGLLDLPDLPIWTPQAEIDLGTSIVAGEAGPILPAEARAFVPRAKAIPFVDRAVGPWAQSWDLYGDGSVQIVPMPGHTPGSVGVLVQLSDGRRIFDVGDTVWVREGYEQREPKGWPATLFDSDAASNDLQIQRLWALHRADPELQILPAHDRRQWDAVFANGPCVE
jgi:N-acyl homoserine lactone hydrolase